MFETVLGKSQAELELTLSHIQGKEYLKWVTPDMCDPYRNWVRSNFPQASHPLPR